MNSTKGQSAQPKPPPPSTSHASLPLSDQERAELAALRREKGALSQMMWNLVRLSYPATHVVEVHSAPTDPLWQLAFVHSSDKESGKVRILAGTIPPITESQKKRVIRLLRGTSKPMHEAIAELGYEFPAAYVEKQIEAHVKWDAEKDTWASVTRPGVGERARNMLGMKKV